MQDIPETAEGVALALLKLILRDEMATKTEVLRIYAECLSVAGAEWLRSDCRNCPMLPHH